MFDAKKIYETRCSKWGKKNFLTKQNTWLDNLNCSTHEILKFEVKKMKKIENIKVIKRDGSEVSFNIGKIEIALAKAFVATEKDIGAISEVVREVTAEVESFYDRGTREFSIDLIQKSVENALVFCGHQDVADAYRKYREHHDKLRRKFGSIDEAIESLQKKDSLLVHENANKDSRQFHTKRDQTAGAVAKVVGLEMLPPPVATAHYKGIIHFHDLDYHPYEPMTNCCLIDFAGMLKNGFRMGNADIESPKSIGTAAAQMAQIIANVASSQYGGCSADRIDEILEPYAELNFEKHLEVAEKWKIPNAQGFARDKTIKDIYDAIQSLEYEVNTLFTSNGQTPFVTFGFGLGETWLAREIQKAILRVRIEGIGAEKRTAIFPKLVFTLKRGLNLRPNDPNYDIKQLAIECATKRMYPDILSYDKIIELTGSFKVPMGCRSFLQGWKNDQGEEINSGRMNLGVVTLNLPRIALESRDLDAVGNFERFWRIFEERLDVAHDALLYRIGRCKEATPDNAPILYKFGAFGKRLASNQSVDEVFKNRRATISLGYIGLYEVCRVFYGAAWETDPQAVDFALSIVKAMKERCEWWSQTYGYHFSVYSTPSESLTDRFCRLDAEKFGLVEDITDKGYYTNSFHYDVRKNPTPFEKLDFEKQFVEAGATGGFIHYCEYPNMRQNPKALEAVWDYAYDRVGYLGTNTPIDRCYKCNFEGDFDPTERGFKCPECGNTDPDSVDVVKRTCGYLGNPQARPMVRGRHKEISARVKHMNSSSL